MGAAAAAVYRPGRRVLANDGGKRAPRYFVQIWQFGGVDGVWTTDPKGPRDVARGIDVPYKPKDILGTKHLQLGPHYKELGPWASRTAIVRGVRLGTANHDTGGNQMLRFRTNWSYSAPSLVDAIGSSRDTQAVSALYLGALEPFDQSSTGAFGEADLELRVLGEGRRGLLTAVDAAMPEDLAHIARGLSRQADRVAKLDTSLRGQRTVDSWRSAATFLQRVSKLPKFEFKPSTKKPDKFEEHLARTAWALEHDLTRSVTLRCLNWDTHSHNEDDQFDNTSQFLPVFAKFLKKLAETRNAHGTLLDQTMILMGSELGRYPRLNNDAGKDHFPEANYTLIGAGFNHGTGSGIAFGGTDREMASLPVDPATGQVAKVGMEVDLDDVGTTLVQLCGVDPRRFGYSGRILPFLAPSEAA